jgi:diamine N-acetyltransferase
MIELYTPTVEDLWFREKMLGDEQTMSYNHAYGGTIPFPKEMWMGWYNQWVAGRENKRFYRYIKEKDTFLGEVAYYFDNAQQVYIANVIVYAPYRGKGYGSKGLLLLCEAARAHGISVLYDDIAVDNPSVSLFLKCGFAELLRTSEYVLVKKEL